MKPRFLSDNFDNFATFLKKNKDVVIMTDELSKITEGIEISKKTNRVIKQNLILYIQFLQLVQS